MRPFILVGDETDHGGVVITGAPSTEVNGRCIARVGDKVTCPKKGHGDNQIVEGDPMMIIDGQPVALHGHKTACGAVLISSQMNSGFNEAGGGASPSEAVNTGQDSPTAFLATLKTASGTQMQGASETTDTDPTI